jgi:hypothetical protein
LRHNKGLDDPQTAWQNFRRKSSVEEHPKVSVKRQDRSHARKRARP